MAQEIPTGAGLTFEKVWLMFQETDRRFQEMEVQAAAERKQAEARAEAERKQAEARAEAERAKEREERKEDRKELERIIGRLGNRLGEFVEELVRPGLVRLFNERGVPIQETAQRLKRRVEGEDMEVDLIGINGEDVVVVEIKSRLTVEDVRDHLYRMANFKRFFPRYADNRLIGAVSGMVIAEESDKFAYRQGLFVIAPSGESVHLLNDENFQPRHW